MRRYHLLAVLVCLCGCAGGPTHDYYNPAVVNGPRFEGPATILRVDELSGEKQKCLQDGYTLMGTTDYVGKYPEAKELKAQARRAHANHVLYSIGTVPAKPGSWHFGLWNHGAWGGTDHDQCEVHIAFLGRSR